MSRTTRTHRGFPTDVFSLGITLLCVVTGKNPMISKDKEDTLKNNRNFILKEKRVRREIANDAVASVVCGMIAREPNSRCSMQDTIVSVQLVAFNLWGYHL